MPKYSPASPPEIDAIVSVSPPSVTAHSIQSRTDSESRKQENAHRVAATASTEGMRAPENKSDLPDASRAATRASSLSPPANNTAAAAETAAQQSPAIGS